jgi:hypothetical protein
VAAPGYGDSHEHSGCAVRDPVILPEEGSDPNLGNCHFTVIDLDGLAGPAADHLELLLRLAQPQTDG